MLKIFLDSNQSQSVCIIDLYIQRVKTGLPTALNEKKNHQTYVFAIPIVLFFFAVRS